MPTDDSQTLERVVLLQEDRIRALEADRSRQSATIELQKQRLGGVKGLLRAVTRELVHLRAQVAMLEATRPSPRDPDLERTSVQVRRRCPVRRSRFTLKATPACDTCPL